MPSDLFSENVSPHLSFLLSLMNCFSDPLSSSILHSSLHSTTNTPLPYHPATWVCPLPPSAQYPEFLLNRQRHPLCRAGHLSPGTHTRVTDHCAGAWRSCGVCHHSAELTLALTPHLAPSSGQQVQPTSISMLHPSPFLTAQYPAVCWAGGHKAGPQKLRWGRHQVR